MVNPLPAPLVIELRRHYFTVLLGPQPDHDVEPAVLIRNFGAYTVECNFDFGTVIVHNWTPRQMELT